MEKEITIERLLLFVNSYSVKMETFIYNQIDFLNRTKLYKITVLCHYFPDPSFNINPDIEVIPLNLNASWSRRMGMTINFMLRDFVIFLKLLKYGRNTVNFSLFNLADKLYQKKFDLIHAHFGQNGQLLAELKDAGILDAKLITQFHGIDFTRKVYNRAYYSELVKYGDVIIAVTEFSKSKLLNLGFNISKIQVIPVGSEPYPLTSESSVIKKKDSTFKILFVGRLIELKGVHLIPLLAEKLQKIFKTKFKITVIGDGPLKELLMNNHLLIENGYLEVLGFRYIHEVKKNMADCDVLIYPGIEDKEGRVENQCVTLQEAMFMRLPLIATNVGGIPECVIEGVTGCLVEPHDLDSFIDKIILLSQDEDFRNKIVNQAYDFAFQKYEMNVVMKQIINVYNN